MEKVDAKQPTHKHVWSPNEDLWNAVKAENIDDVNKALENGADIDFKHSDSSHTHCSVLHVAAMTGNKTLVEMLLDRGANVKAQDRRGNTPSDYALKAKHPEIADMLSEQTIETWGVPEGGTNAPPDAPKLSEIKTSATFQIKYQGTWVISDLIPKYASKKSLSLNINFPENPYETKASGWSGADVVFKMNHKFKWNVDQLKKIDPLKFEITVRSPDFHEMHIATLYGKVKDLATGVSQFDLPMFDDPDEQNGKQVCRLTFEIEMEQISEIGILFHEIAFSNIEPHSHEINSYVKLSVSPGLQPKKVFGKNVVYTNITHGQLSPVWRDLQELRVTSGLKRLLREHVVIRLAHKGKFSSETLYRVNLHFTSLIGKNILYDEKINFKATLLKHGKQPLPEIYGSLSFHNLPHISQMMPTMANIMPIHKELGIIDAVAVLPDVFMPDCNVSVNLDKKNSKVSTIKITTLSDLRRLSKSLGKSENDEETNELKQMLKQ